MHGIKNVYKNGKCKFLRGSYGHVWEKKNRTRLKTISGSLKILVMYDSALIQTITQQVIVLNVEKS